MVRCEQRFETEALRAYLRAGHSRAEAARHFGVSRAAITKRLKTPVGVHAAPRKSGTDAGAIPDGAREAGGTVGAEPAARPPQDPTVEQGPRRSPPDAPEGSGGAPGNSQEGSRTLKPCLTEAQVARARLLCGRLASLPPKPKGFRPEVFLDACVRGGLPTDAALKILHQLTEHWGNIVDPWVHAQEFLDRGYRQYGITLKGAEVRTHEAGWIGALLAEATKGMPPEG